jgi:hypothetical protein
MYLNGGFGVSKVTHHFSRWNIDTKANSNVGRLCRAAFMRFCSGMQWSDSVADPVGLKCIDSYGRSRCESSSQSISVCTIIAISDALTDGYA